MKFPRTILSSLMASLFLTACLGGGGDGTTADNNASNNNNENTNNTSALTGVVADGYLSGAKVCLDKNSNWVCDADEPFASTNSNGQYSISNISAEDRQKYSVIVEVPATAIDQDTGKAVGAPFLLAAPAGKPEFISPLTTLVQKQLQDSPGLSVIDAEAAVKNKMGYAGDADLSLFEDYVAEKTNSTNSDIKKGKYGAAHKVAQTVAQVMKDNHSSLQGVASLAGMNETVRKELNSILLDQVMPKLEQMKEAAIKDGFTPESAVSSIGLNKEKVQSAFDPVTLKQQIATKQLIGEAKAGDAANLLQDGFYWAD